MKLHHLMMVALDEEGCPTAVPGTYPRQADLSASWAGMHCSVVSMPAAKKQSCSAGSVNNWSVQMSAGQEAILEFGPGNTAGTTSHKCPVTILTAPNTLRT